MKIADIRLILLRWVTYSYYQWISILHMVLSIKSSMFSYVFLFLIVF